MFEQIVGRPIAVFMLSIALSLFGFLAYQELPISLMPPLDYPTVTIQAILEGAAPEEIEMELTKKIEERVSTVEGLLSLRSTSQPGLCEIKLEFRWGEDLNQIVQRVLERIDRIELPKGAQAPQVLRYDPTLEPVMVLALTDESDFLSEAQQNQQISELRHYATKVLLPQLQQIEGVAAVKIIGGVKEEIKVDIDPKNALQYQLNSNLIAQKIRASQVNLAGGKLNESGAEILVRSLSQIKSMADLQNLVILFKDGAWLKLKDLAQVVLGYEERQAWVSIGKNEAIRLQIYRQADANLLKVSQRLRQQFHLIKEQESHGIKEILFKINQPNQSRAYLLYDQSIFIKNALDDLKASALLGGLLAILILYLFLKSSYQTLVIAIAIPLSLTIAFVPMNLFGISLNLMSLGGLALGVGMLVDNSVVVLENIDRRRLLGDSAMMAAITGVQEVATAVIASTLTTVAVFLPVAFVDGVAGQIFGDLAITVVCSLLASLLVAIIVVPVASAFSPEPKIVEGNEQSQDQSSPQSSSSPQASSRALTWVSFPRITDIWQSPSALWRKLIRLPISLPWYFLRLSLVLFANLVLLILSLIYLVLKLCILPCYLIAKVTIVPLAELSAWLINHLITLYGLSLRASLKIPVLIVVIAFITLLLSLNQIANLKTTLLPDVSQGVLIVEAEYAVGTSLQESKNRTNQLIDQIKLWPEISSIEALIGKDEGDEMGGPQRGSHQAQLRVLLRQAQQEEDISLKLRTLFQTQPELKTQISKPSLFSLRPPLRIVFKSVDLDKLMDCHERMLAILAGIPDVHEVKSTMTLGYPELQLFFDEAKLKQYQLSTLDVAEQVKGYLAGEEAVTLQWGADLIPVIVRLDQSMREDLEQFHVISPQGKAYPLSAIASWKRGVGPAQISHTDAQRSVEISASVTASQLGERSAQLSEKINQAQWPSHVEISLNGQDQEMNDSLHQLFVALLISIFLVYVVMATQFESILIPFLIMGTVPLALIGVILGLLLTQTPVSVVVAIALIILAGIVVNNAIVFLEKTQQNQLEKLDQKEALIEAGKSRLRPILMTTLTTLLGLLPMLWDQGEGAELRYPLALTLIFGLSISTLLTLYVIPALYMIFGPTQILRPLDETIHTESESLS